jgi:hypothetical protein
MSTRTIESKIDRRNKVNDFIEFRNDEMHEKGEYYNCMGWALNIKQWLRPLDLYGVWDSESTNREERINELLWEYEYDEDATREAFTNQEVEALKDVWGLRFATKEEIADENVTLIAFREAILFCLDGDGEICCYDGDFHFRKRIDGVWTEKLGSDSIQVCDEPIDTVWNDFYDGDIFYFVKEA